MLGINPRIFSIRNRHRRSDGYDLKLTCRSLIADPVHDGYNTSW